MRKKLYIKADNYNIKFSTDCEDAINYILDHKDEFKKVTINFSIMKEKKCDFIINYIDNAKTNYLLNSNNEIRVEFPWNLNDKKSILPIIFRQVVELLRQENDEIKLHASAIEKDGKVALFIAPSEGGKTTTAMAMCQKFNYSFFANDASVVKFKNNIPFMLRGDQEFKVRLNSLKAYSKKYYKDQSTKFDDNKELWYNKSKIEPGDIGVNLSTGVNVITHIFFIKLDALVDGCVINHYNSNKDVDKWFKPKMQVFQNINGTIRGGDLIPYGNDGIILDVVIPSLDTEELYKRRVKFINDLFNSCEIYQLRGQLDDITMFINERMKNSE